MMKLTIFIEFDDGAFDSGPALGCARVLREVAVSLERDGLGRLKQNGAAHPAPIPARDRHRVGISIARS